MSYIDYNVFPIEFQFPSRVHYFVEMESFGIVPLHRMRTRVIQEFKAIYDNLKNGVLTTVIFDSGQTILVILHLG